MKILSSDKLIGSINDEGIIVTSDPDLAEKVKVWMSDGLKIHVPPKQGTHVGHTLLDGARVIRLGPDTIHLFANELVLLGYTIK
jgi:hypothetical protein